MNVLVTTTKFDIGQKVFYLEDGNVESAKICKMEITVGKNSKVIKEVYYAVEQSFLGWLFGKNIKLPENIHSSAELLFESIKNAK